MAKKAYKEAEWGKEENETRRTFQTLKVMIFVGQNKEERKQISAHRRSHSVYILKNPWQVQFTNCHLSSHTLFPGLTSSCYCGNENFEESLFILVTLRYPAWEKSKGQTSEEFS